MPGFWSFNTLIVCLTIGKNSRIYYILWEITMTFERVKYLSIFLLVALKFCYFNYFFASVPFLPSPRRKLQYCPDYRYVGWWSRLMTGGLFFWTDCASKNMCCLKKKNWRRWFLSRSPKQISFTFESQISLLTYVTS